MPIISNSRDTFTWQVNQDGVPLTETITLGGIPYTPCCPLCGCWHELKSHITDEKVEVA